VVDRAVNIQPNIDTAEINRLIANKNRIMPGKLLRTAQPPLRLSGNDRIRLHANLNGVSMSSADMEEGEFCKCSVYRDAEGTFEFRDKMCYTLWPVTKWGALARHMREDHLSLPVRH
jgi:hypothetical protein